MRQIDYSKIPESTIEALTAWIEQGRPMGHFCAAVVSNDLREACARADDRNRAALWEIVAWLHNHAPIASWGSPAALKRWPDMISQRPAPRRRQPRPAPPAAP
jgi:hypothetical protein